MFAKNIKLMIDKMRNTKFMSITSDMTLKIYKLF